MPETATRRPRRPKLSREELKLPTCPESERAVVGCLLLDQTQMAPVASILKARDFSDPFVKAVFQTCLELDSRGKDLAVAELADEMIRKGRAESYPQLLVSLAEFEQFVIVSAHAAQHARKVAETARLRRLGSVAIETYLRVCQGQDAQGNFLEPKAILAGAETAIVKIQNEEIESATKSIAETVLDVVDRAEKIQKGQLASAGVLTHYCDLDRYTCGMFPGNLWIIAARPSIGKTAFAGCLAHNIAKGGGLLTPVLSQPGSVFYGSLEMTKEEITQRILAGVSSVSLTRIRSPKHLTDIFLRELAAASEKVASLPISIDDTAAIRPQDLRAKVRLWHAQAENPQVAFIDHLNLMDPDRQSRDGRVNDVTAITKGLKGLAKELNITVVALCQLNRRIEHRAKADGRLPRPMLSDLRESGSIEQDADVVLFLHRDRQSDEPAPSENDPHQAAEIIIGKQRNGPTGVIPLFFRRQHCVFLNGVRQ